ncbi:hypothetical protein J6590_075229 [Homalodisca vitripennis]|nr:hypothetical protein J6590_075229 [Homalodisca vitripennis]
MKSERAAVVEGERLERPGPWRSRARLFPADLRRRPTGISYSELVQEEVVKSSCGSKTEVKTSVFESFSIRL